MVREVENLLLMFFVGEGFSPPAVVDIPTADGLKFAPTLHFVLFVSPW